MFVLNCLWCLKKFVKANDCCYVINAVRTENCANIIYISFALQCANTSISRILSFIRARLGFMTKPLCEKILSMGADVAGMQKTWLNNGRSRQYSFRVRISLVSSYTKASELMQLRNCLSCCAGLSDFTTLSVELLQWPNSEDFAFLVGVGSWT